MKPDQETEEQIIALEKQYWQAIKERDYQTALALTDDPCIVTGAQGVAALDHETFKQMMNAETWRLDDFAISDMKVELIGDDIAIVAYKVHEEMSVDGKKVKLDAADASTWRRQNGSWVCALHTESLLGDPFGRGRSS